MGCAGGSCRHDLAALARVFIRGINRQCFLELRKRFLIPAASRQQHSELSVHSGAGRESGGNLAEICNRLVGVPRLGQCVGQIIAGLDKSAIRRKSETELRYGVR